MHVCRRQLTQILSMLTLGLCPRKSQTLWVYSAASNLHHPYITLKMMIWRARFEYFYKVSDIKCCNCEKPQQPLWIFERSMWLIRINVKKGKSGNFKSAESQMATLTWVREKSTWGFPQRWRGTTCRRRPRNQGPCRVELVRGNDSWIFFHWHLGDQRQAVLEEIYSSVIFILKT
jgi:hypothetical protein